jgi:hypothetical protein
MTRLYQVAFIGLFSLILFSCSSAERDYRSVQNFQDAAEQIMQHSFDYDAKIKSCNDVIAVLNGFLQKHSSGEWASTAR